MEPITHFLTGACIRDRPDSIRKTALATATVTLAAEAPDLDVLGELKGRVFGFAHHRGFTHSFLGIALVSAAVVGLMYGAWRLRGRKLNNPDLPPRWGLLFGFAYLAGLSHILLDYTNNYGVRPFWPFSEKWYSWDIVFIVEPILLILLVSRIGVLPVFLLIHRSRDRRLAYEATRRPLGRNYGVARRRCALGKCAGNYGTSARSECAREARTYRGSANPLRASAFPFCGGLHFDGSAWWKPGISSPAMMVDSSGS